MSTLALRFCRAAGCIAFAALVAAPAQAQLRVATWNITSYTGGRVTDIQTAAYGLFEGRSFSPDVIVVQEVMSLTAANELRNALNNAPGSPGGWAAQFVSGDVGLEGNTLLYRNTRVIYRGRLEIGGPGTPVPPRNPVRYTLWLQGYAGGTAVLFIYNSHMKAGSTPDDAAQRRTEAEWIRADAESLPAGSHFLLGGDFNVYTSGEEAYAELTGTQTNDTGRFFDPIATPGAWNNNCTYRFVHTQDPIGPGGLDDRFDQLLLSANLVDGDGFDYLGDPSIPYSTTTWNDLNHSYRAWGNDGTSCNSSLRVAGNSMVGPIIAQALINTTGGSAGHLPVFLDLLVPPRIASDTALTFGAVVQGSNPSTPLAVSNAGDVALWTAAGIAPLSYTLAADPGFSVPAGPFSALAGDPANAHLVTLDAATLGARTGLLTVASNAPEEPARQVSLSAHVYERGDMNCDDALDFADINAFVLALLSGEAGYTSQFPTCNFLLADLSTDDPPHVGFEDINPFVAALLE